MSNLPLTALNKKDEEKLLAFNCWRMQHSKKCKVCESLHCDCTHCPGCNVSKNRGEYTMCLKCKASVCHVCLERRKKICPCCDFKIGSKLIFEMK